MDQNWIVENLNNAFTTWNEKLTELWGLVTTSPATFKGGAVWGIIQTIHGAMLAIGYALVILFFAMSLFKNTANFHELKRPEAALHYLIRFVAAKTMVGYGMEIMLKVFEVCNGIVSEMAASMGGISQAMVSLPGEVQTAIENVGFLASIPLWLVTILGSLFITVLSFIMILTVYGRFFRLYSGVSENLCGCLHGRRGHCTGLHHLCRLCGNPCCGHRRSHHNGLELSGRNGFQYVGSCGPY